MNTCDIVHDGIAEILYCDICAAWLTLLAEETENGR